MLKLIALWGAGLLLSAIAALAVAYWYSLSLPGESFTGPPPPLTDEEHHLAQRLRRHVTAIASEPHNIVHYDALEKSAVYIEAELRALGYEPVSQAYDVDGKSVRNISVEIAPQDAGPATPSLVVGAHYDSYGNAPGANDNGSGSAAVIELARLLKDMPLKDKRLRLVLFVNEEPPYDRTPDMGSYRFAKQLKDNGEKLIGMVSLETIGAFSDQPGTQKYPPPFDLIFPDVANFVALVALPGGRSFLHEFVASFRGHTKIPTIGGTAPDFIDGIGWSDHWAFYMFGYPAIMITDTALFRYPEYHTPSDTPDKVDYDKLAHITQGVAATVRDLLQ
ncbi:M28 family peptidase [Hyphomicrobium sp. 1Nfss2.1]|uniref:M28 family peptidase n=1 Tax=Hyphomicrobium sp. 1Nfss2.1 TaxID=3413936 RepID=UPI003C7E8975